jgi:glyoxylase-like metal-dependent hydrolase (beta-lactamase superfamily II)
LILHSFTVNPFAENTYVLSDGDKALIVDPGFFYQAEIDRLTAYLATSGLTPVAVVQTHAHIDHIIGIPAVLKLWPELPVYMHPDDKENWRRVPETAAKFGFKMDPIPDVTIAFESTGMVDLHGFEMDVRHVPGHAPGHLVFHFEKEGILIAGDTLFQGSIGRTDLYKGDFETLASAIRSQLYTLPEQTLVYPGHGPHTTIGEEMHDNPFVRLA